MPLSPEQTLFPKKFCGSRWLENGDVAERAIQLIPSLRKFAHEIKRKPKSYSFATVSEALNDPHLVTL